ncbi:MAG TPA: sulfur oxidation c-type cytochrome SoxX [Nitrospirae bacterium]|nr:sulfur oxidation c-type cytochrome SoxX [Nitrospirota bacterium]
MKGGNTMYKKTKRRLMFPASVVIAVFLFLVVPAIAMAGGNAAKGEKVVKTRKLGNCIACHVLPGLAFPGDIGPNLIKAMQHYSRSDRATVRQWVYDARKFNSDTIMPPFGTNKILTNQQIDDVVAYLYSLKKSK